MKNIGKELPVDKKGLLVIIPAAILVIVASMCFGSSSKRAVQDFTKHIVIWIITFILGPCYICIYAI